MKLLTICGSPRKGNSFKVLNEIPEQFPPIEFEALQLKDLNFDLCKGCYDCVTRGEEKCPIKDDRDKAHRPRFFDKYALSVVTCSGYGAEDA